MDTFGLGPHKGNKFLFTLQGYQCSGLSVRGRMRKTFITITIRVGMRKIISSFILKNCADCKKKKIAHCSACHVDDNTLIAFNLLYL